MRAGEYRDSRGNVYPNRGAAMKHVAKLIDKSVGAQMSALSGNQVLVGLPVGSDPYPVTGESVIDVAFKNEFGQGNIPERPFLRTTVTGNMQQYLHMIERDLPAVINGKLSPRSLYARVGNRMQADVKNAIQEWSTPPNSKATQIAKGRKAGRKEIAAYQRREPEHGDNMQSIGLSLDDSGQPMINNPLVDTGHLHGAIRYVVERVHES